ncbi:MAG: hypothetical protein ACYSTS_09800 [Planctomycetota bacterium]|jgi:hypothetical protein
MKFKRNDNKDAFGKVYNLVDFYADNMTIAKMAKKRSIIPNPKSADRPNSLKILSIIPTLKDWVCGMRELKV